MLRTWFSAVFGEIASSMPISAFGWPRATSCRTVRSRSVSGPASVARRTGGGTRRARGRRATGENTGSPAAAATSSASRTSAVVAVFSR